ncbi:MAG: ABC transporter substrate-binding protein [Deltaproteobacteria bacterium]|nr:ABC transporter substrate-binding protein [Deltaproteobacteria bacterium]
MARTNSCKKFWHQGGFNNRAPIGLGIVLMVITGSVVMPLAAKANPYLARPGEAAVAVSAATCATTGGFVHFYVALDNGLFDKYGLKVNHVALRGPPIAMPALSTDQIQFLYCAGAATIPGMATGTDAKLVASPHVGLPWVLLARKDVKKVEDLRGKTIGVSRTGDWDHRVSKLLLKKFNLTEQEVMIRSMGGSQPEKYQAMVMDIIQATPVGPPLDVQGKKDGFNVIYNLNDLGMPFIYSSVHTNSKTLRERPWLVQKFVAAIAEAVYFVEKNPDKAKSSIGRVHKLDDPEALQSAYDTFSKTIINRSMIVPAKAVEEAVQIAREDGTNIRKKPAELFDNSFIENLEKSGFLKEIWGSSVPGK